jgi:alkanesulfonate monooxygenase SsuD/methylene tetrahydromethanopterin reductase-like flavin-dependent oxidoreductase (luciferase family)
VNLGVFGLNATSTRSPGQALRLAQRTEALGYTSWWAGEHVVLASPRTAGCPPPGRRNALGFPTRPLVSPSLRSAHTLQDPG